MLTGKRGLILVSVILFSLFLIPDSFAQQCYIDVPNGIICQSSLEQGQTTSVAPYQTSCSNLPQYCEFICYSCSAGGTPTENIWTQKVRACEDTQEGWITSGPVTSATSESQCDSAAPAQSQSPATVRGKVRNSANQPVADADVSCGINSATSVKSTSTGDYILSGCFPGSQKIHAQKGVLSGDSLTVNLPSGGDTGGMDITLSSASTTTLTVRVQNSANQLIKANVTVGNSKQEQGTAAPVQFPNVQTGDVQITAQKSGYGLEIITFPLSAVANTATITLQPVPTGKISGFVRDGTSALTPKPVVSGATIKLTDTTRNIIVDTKTTGADGKFEFINIPLGPYSLEVTTSPKGKGIAPVTLLAISGVSQDVNVFPETVSATTNLELTVRDKTTTSIVDRAFVKYFGLYTDAQGKTSLPLQNGLPYFIEIAHPDYKPYISGQIVGGLTAANFELIPYVTVRVTGKVINGSDLSKKVVSGATVSILGNTVSTDNSGNFQLDIKALTASPLALFVKDSRFVSRSLQITLPEQTTYSVGNIELTQQVCTNEKVNLLTPQQNLDKIQLSWTFDCRPDSYVISKNNVPIYASTDTSKLDYLDSNIKGETSYCYQIKATYHRGGIIGDIVASSDKLCIDSSSEDCFNGDKTVCNGNTLVQCSSGAKTETQCQSNELCIEQTETVAQCVKSNSCELCNRPFGVFSTQASQFGALFGGIGSESSLSEFKADRGSLFDCTEKAVACYVDSSKTIVDKYYSCNGIDSCYDYTSQDACEQQSNKCTPAENCEWMPSQYEELGVGVCRPTEETKQNCNEFELSESKVKGITNEVFASQTCRLYGDSCYFSSVQDRCLNKEEVSCYDYSDKNDCIGEGNDAQHASVNVMWQTPPMGTTYTKKSGTNQISNSNDYFEIGICKFINGCIRDADDNQNQSKYPLAGNKKFESGSGRVRDGYDCPENDPLCNTDSSPPSTFLDVNDGSRININELMLDVVDDSLSKDPLRVNKIKTWYSAVDTNNLPPNTYPSLRANLNRITLSGEGPRSIFYFSEDHAHNLELIKRVDVILDKTSPKIDFSYVVIPDLSSGTVTFIPTLKLDKTTGDELAFCPTVTFSRLNGGETSLANFKVESNIDSGAKDQWSETYRDIPTRTQNSDGIRVKYSWQCYDLAGNIVSGTQELELDSDMTIYDPQPSLAVKTTGAARSVDISVKTQASNPGECRYSESQIFTNSNYRAAQTLTSQQLPNGDYIHSTTVNIPGSSKYYYVACNLTGIRGIVLGSSSDNIKITIDELAPKTLLFDKRGQQVQGEIWMNGPFLTLKCNDTELRTPGFPTEIGCGTVYSCADDTSECTPQPGQENQPVIPSISKTTNIRYYSVDKLGNTENNGAGIVKRVNFDDIAPGIFIDDSLTNGVIETNQQDLVLIGTVSNKGQDDCSRSPTCTVSPFRDQGTYYKLLNRTGQLRNFTIPIFDLNAESVQMVAPVVLEANQQNDIVIISEDQAGNVVQSDPVTVIQDNLGPDLLGSAADPVVIERADPNFNTQNLYIEYGNDFPVRIRNILDQYPVQTIGDRVSQVWIEDMLGSRYDLIRAVDGWRGVIKTKSWLPSNVFSTYLKLFANDTLGNIAERRIDRNDGFFVNDTTPPIATVRLENKYGEQITTLVSGENYVILDARESLEDAPPLLFFRVGSKMYNVSFFAKDFEGLTWVGTLNIPQGVNSPVIVDGLMKDSNGNPSIGGSVAFSHPAFIIDSRPLSPPRPANSVLDSKLNRYNVTTEQVFYDPLTISSSLLRQYSVNGEITDYNPSSGLLLKKGDNEIEIRLEDQNHHYETTSQNIFVDVVQATDVQLKTDNTAPSINSQGIGYPGITQLNGNLVSKDQTAEISGAYDTGDAVNIYVLGEDGQVYPAELNGGTFIVSSIRLVGRTFEEKANNLVVVFEDASGNKASENIEVIKDLRPPRLVSLLFRP